MTDVNLRSKSRENYLPAKDGMSLEQINVGSLQRIADATEAMAKNHRQLEERARRLEQRNRELYAELSQEIRRRTALRGVITKLRREARRG